MPISTSKEPHELRQSAAAKIAEAKKLSDELDAGGLDADQEELKTQRVDLLCSEAKQEREEADDADRRLQLRAQQRSALRDMATNDNRPIRKTRPGSPNQLNPTATKAFSRGFVDKDGKPLALLAHGESVAEFEAKQSPYGYTSDDGDGRGLGDMIRGVVTGQWDGPLDTEQTTHTTGSDPYGGFMVPGMMAARFIDKARAASVVSQAGALTFPMNSQEVTLLKVTGDPEVGWTGESKKLPNASATFGRLRLRARKVGAYIRVSRELVEDAPNAGEIVESLLRTAAAQEIDRVALLGDADGEEPTGIFNTSGVTENAIGGAVDYDDFLDSVQALKDRNVAPAGIIYPPAVETALAKLKVNGEANHYASAPPTFTDMQRFTTTKLDASQAIVGDFAELIIGVRSDVRVETTAQSAGGPFENDEVWIKLTWRGDIQPMRADHFEKLTGITYA